MLMSGRSETGATKCASLQASTVLLLLTLLFTCATCVPAPQQPVPVGYVHIEDGLVRLMGERHDTLKTEKAVALLGRRIGLVAWVEGFDATITRMSTPDSARFGVFENTRVIGVLHNHPNGVCAPSPKDVRTLYKNPRWLVVMATCGKGRAGYILRGDPRYHVLQVKR